MPGPCGAMMTASNRRAGKPPPSPTRTPVYNLGASFVSRNLNEAHSNATKNNHRKITMTTVKN
jgi:hypothetical protein